jgi:hypothetical protein
MLSPTPPESAIVIVSPLIWTTQEPVLSTRFPAGFTFQQSKAVTATEATEQLSPAVARKEIGASGGTMVAGALHWTVGAVASTTVTEVEAEDALPESSVAVKLTAVVPSGNELGASLATGTSGSQASAAVGRGTETAAW